MRRCDMREAHFDLFQARRLPAFNAVRPMKLRETPINNLILRAERVLPQYLNDNIPSSIYLTDKDLKVMVDVSQMEAALANLIKNARDAMPDGGRLTITTGEASFNGLHTRYGRCGFLSVRDTGSPKNFSSTRDYGEQALRLRMATHIVDQHNGYTKIENLNGSGTAVYLYLPLVKNPAEEVDVIPLGTAQVMQIK
jgi:signal transduction histidine kinase